MKIGLIGAGYWGKKHMAELSHLPGCKLVAVSDLNPANLEKCRMLGIEKTYLDYKELLADSSIEAVSICVSNEMHFEVAKAALLAGKHVLVEKPLTMDTATSMELIALSKKQNKVLCVGHLFRFNNVARKLREMNLNGEFGKLHFIRTQWTNNSPLIANTDVILDLAPHVFDLCNFITGWWPETNNYFGNSFRRTAFDEVAFIRSDYKNGFVHYIELSWLLPEKNRSIFVVGDKMSAKADCGSQRLWVYAPKTLGATEREIKIEPSNALAEELASFISDCTNSNEKASNTGEVGMKVIENILGCKKYPEPEKSDSKYWKPIDKRDL